MINMYIFFTRMKIRTFPHNIEIPILEQPLAFIFTANQPTWITTIKLQQRINNFRKLDHHRCLLRNMSRTRFPTIAENLCNLFEF